MKQVKPCPFECNANVCKDCGAYTYSHHTQTNEEWFCQLPTKEKAEVIFDIVEFCLRYETYPDKNKYKDLMGTVEDIKCWLIKEKQHEM